MEEMEEQLPWLSGVPFTCSVLGDLLCQGWLMESAQSRADRGPKHPELLPVMTAALQ